MSYEPPPSSRRPKTSHILRYSPKKIPSTARPHLGASLCAATTETHQGARSGKGGKGREGGVDGPRSPSLSPIKTRLSSKDIQVMTQRGLPPPRAVTTTLAPPFLLPPRQRFWRSQGISLPTLNLWLSNYAEGDAGEPEVERRVPNARPLLFRPSAAPSRSSTPSIDLSPRNLHQQRLFLQQRVNQNQRREVVKTLQCQPRQRITLTNKVYLQKGRRMQKNIALDTIDSMYGSKVYNSYISDNPLLHVDDDEGVGAEDSDVDDAVDAAQTRGNHRFINKNPYEEHFLRTRAQHDDSAYVEAGTFQAQKLLHCISTLPGRKEISYSGILDYALDDNYFLAIPHPHRQQQSTPAAANTNVVSGTFEMVGSKITCKDSAKKNKQLVKLFAQLISFGNGGLVVKQYLRNDNVEMDPTHMQDSDGIVVSSTLSNLDAAATAASTLKVPVKQVCGWELFRGHAKRLSPSQVERVVTNKLPFPVRTKDASCKLFESIYMARGGHHGQHPRLDYRFV